MIRRVSFGIALALAALTTVACSSPTEPTSKVTRIHGDVSADTTQTSKIGVQGSSISRRSSLRAVAGGSHPSVGRVSNGRELPLAAVAL